MPLDKPYYRCYRPNIKSESLEYIRDPRNVENPYDYIRKIEILYSRLEKIFEYVEPIDSNGLTYSMQTCFLLLDICTTIEANFKDILSYNGYINTKNLNITDYFMINKSHHLSGYKIKIPFWKGAKNVRAPFAKWKTIKYEPLDWYKAYTTVKHNMIRQFNEATIDNLVDSFCGLLVISSAQFYDDSIKIPIDLRRSHLLGDYDSLKDKPYQAAIGGQFMIKYPTDWNDTEKYSFNWNELKENDKPFIKYNYKKHIEKL